MFLNQIRVGKGKNRFQYLYPNSSTSNRGPK